MGTLDSGQTNHLRVEVVVTNDEGDVTERRFAKCEFVTELGCIESLRVMKLRLLMNCN